MTLGEHSTAYDGEINGICSDLQQLHLHKDKLKKAVIIVGSKVVILLEMIFIEIDLVSSREKVQFQEDDFKRIITMDIRALPNLWNKSADALAKNEVKITQTHLLQPYHSIKLYLK